MKKISVLVILICFSVFSFAQNWVNINASNSHPAKVVLIAGDISNSSFNVDVQGYFKNEVTTPQGQKTIISLENSTPILEAGAPDIPKVATSLIIPDNQNMMVEVTYSNYVEYQNIDIAPSKGNFTRDIDPSTVPYTYGPAYSQNQFFPGTLAELKEPYILRDFRGQTVLTYPFQYNPVTKVLRVYNNLSVNVHTAASTVVNPFNRTQPLSKIEKEFSNVYDHQFLNYYSNHKYTPLDEHGRMLIICYGTFMEEMQPFVNWKNDEGIPTEIVNVTTAGATAAAIKTYVTNYYNTNGLTFLLLVGDAAQIPTFTVTGGGSDPTYGYITGSDHFQEFFVGRFSAETEAQVTTQVIRTISYEKTPLITPGKFNHCVGIASSQGPGDDNEYDYTHVRNILDDLTGYNYTSRAELFDGSQGGVDVSGDATAAQLTTEVNNGSGIITYCGHGADTYFVTTGFSNTNASALTNTTMWPFIWAVACVNGNFVSQTCFAEAWLRASSGGQPTGAVATLMSTINQSWNPPMEGEDEMVDILVESYTNNIKRTYGGLSVNGIFKMNDTYSDYDMTDTWTIFGDPSLMVRTDDPMSMTVSHASSVMLGESGLAVNCNVNGAFVCLTINHQIIGTGTVSGGIANITFPALTTSDSILVTATAYNYIPYQGKVSVIEELLADDAQAFSILEPQITYSCVGLTVQPKVIIKNMGSNNLALLNATFIFDGTPSVINWIGNLPSFGADTIFFPNITLNSGSHTITFYTSQPNGNSDTHKSNDTIFRNIQVNDLPVSSAFNADITNSCASPLTVQFTNNSQNATSYLWDFGDGSTSTEQNPSHVFTALGVYNITLTADAGACGNDINSQNDFILVGTTPPVVSDTSSCGPNSFVLSAFGTGTINWFDAPVGGTLINTGSSYTTPLLSNTTSYYIEQSMIPPLEYVGKTSKEASALLHTNNSYWLVFDCYSPVVLKSVKVYAGAAGDRIINLRNSSGAVIQTATINFPAGESRITLDFNIPVGTDMQLMCGTTNPNMYRDDSGITFPYELQGKISITGTNATSAIRYYYFYDWEIESPTCSSARSSLTAYINATSPTADFSFITNNNVVSFTDLSSDAASYFWDFGDAATSTLSNPTHTYALAGTYAVQQTVTNGCGANSTIKNVVIDPSGVIEETIIRNISIYPNPTTDNTITIAYENINIPVIISIYDVIGGLVDRIENKDQTSRLIKLEYNTGLLQSGIYFIEFNYNNNKLVKKLVVNN